MYTNINMLLVKERECLIDTDNQVQHKCNKVGIECGKKGEIIRRTCARTLGVNLAPTDERLANTVDESSN